MLRELLMNADGGAPEGGATPEVTTEVVSTEAKALTMEDVQKLIQSETDKVRTEYSKKLKEADKVIKSKMTEDEAKAHELAEKERLLAEKEALYTRKELEINAVDELNKHGLPVTFREFLLGSDSESTTKNIESFNKLFKAELEKAVGEKIKGKTPATGGTPIESASAFFNTIKDNQRKR